MVTQLAVPAMAFGLLFIRAMGPEHGRGGQHHIIPGEEKPRVADDPDRGQRDRGSWQGV